MGKCFSCLFFTSDWLAAEEEEKEEDDCRSLADDGGGGCTRWKKSFLPLLGVTSV